MFTVKYIDDFGQQHLFFTKSKEDIKFLIYQYGEENVFILN